MSSKNDITGDKLQTKPQNDKYSEGWERIFGKKPVTRDIGDGIILSSENCIHCNNEGCCECLGGES